ncbi:site-specific integrase [Clostridia bacterium]|nr:site-specific integrase [Clostridia bacterium]
MAKHSRRGNNEGSIYQREDGLWVAQITLGINEETGKPKRKSIYGKSRAEVAQKLNFMIGNTNNYGVINETKDSLKTKMTRWLLDFKMAEVTSRTFEGCMRNAKLHIFPHIGDLPYTKVSTEICQRLLAKTLYIEKKLGLATVKKVQFLLNQFYDYLLIQKEIKDNPVRNTKISPNERDKLKKKEYKAIRPEHRNLFFKAINKHKVWKPLCLTILFSSPRIGEILALKWRNIELVNPDLYGIKIENSATVKVNFDENGNVLSREQIIGVTKSAASERENPLPDIVVDALREYKKMRQLEQAITGYSYVGDDDFVFGNDEGALRSYSGTRTMFDRFLKRNKLDKLNIHFHTLRHTFSNMLFEANENPKVIQSLLGHKDVKTTMIYNSVDKKQTQSARVILNKFASEME